MVPSSMAPAPGAAGRGVELHLPSLSLLSSKNFGRATFLRFLKVIIQLRGTGVGAGINLSG
jgi:hypothetical protein